MVLSIYLGFKHFEKNYIGYCKLYNQILTAKSYNGN